MKLFRFVSNLYRLVRDRINVLFKAIMFYQLAPYHIEEIDLTKQQLVIRCRGTRSIMRPSYVDVIADDTIIRGLSPMHACWVGGYFGRAFRSPDQKKEMLGKMRNISFSLKNNRGRYKIIFQNRNGDIGYFDQKTKREFVEHPLTVANNEYIISGFDPSQACYIGMLAGISMEKTMAADAETGAVEVDEIMKKPPKLRVVS